MKLFCRLFKRTQCKTQIHFDSGQPDIAPGGKQAIYLSFLHSDDADDLGAHGFLPSS
jgi:hypothetical protein